MDKSGHSWLVNMADPDFESKIRDMLLADGSSIYSSDEEPEVEIDNSN